MNQSTNKSTDNQTKMGAECGGRSTDDNIKKLMNNNKEFFLSSRRQRRFGVTIREVECKPARFSAGSAVAPSPSLSSEPTTSSPAATVLRA